MTFMELTPLGNLILHVLSFLIVYRVLSTLLSAGYYLLLRVLNKPKEDAKTIARDFFNSVQFIR